MITSRVELTGNSRITYRDGDTIVGEILTAASGTGRQLFVALAHDWSGDSDGYDPIVADTTDDKEQAEAEISKRYAGYLEYLRANGVTTTTTAELVTEQEPTTKVGDRVTHATLAGVWLLEARYSDGRVHLTPDDAAAIASTADGRRGTVASDQLEPWTPETADVDPALADDPNLTTPMRSALRNLLDMEDSYAEMAPSLSSIRANAHTGTALEARGYVERVSTEGVDAHALRAMKSAAGPKLRRYRLTPVGRGLAKLLESRSVKIAIPADPFAGFPREDEL